VREPTVIDLFGNITDRALSRLKEFEPEEGYYLAYSGGKDSDVILDLARRSGVKFDAHHHLTTCDPPELVRHVKTHPDVIVERPPYTMWQLVRRHHSPPRRQARYCCQELKERGGDGRLVLTGVRWEESARRAQRKMVEQCYSNPTKRYLHPIIDWSASNVWEYIRSRKIPYCTLYDEGFKRLGCVLCPMVRNVQEQIQRWPAIARAWERAIKATFVPGKRDAWPDAEAYWQWWLNRDAKAEANDFPLFFRD
jgi:phosphoadenosine phosphosulfate reductase